MSNYEYWFSKLMVFKAEEADMIIKLDAVISAMGLERAKQSIKTKTDLDKALKKLYGEDSDQKYSTESKDRWQVDSIFDSIKTTIEYIIQRDILDNKEINDGKLKCMDKDRLEKGNATYKDFQIADIWGHINFDPMVRTAATPMIKELINDYQWIKQPREVWTFINHDNHYSFVKILLSDYYYDYHNWTIGICNILKNHELLNQFIGYCYREKQTYTEKLKGLMGDLDKTMR